MGRLCFHGSSNDWLRLLARHRALIPRDLQREQKPEHVFREDCAMKTACYSSVKRIMKVRADKMDGTTSDGGLRSDNVLTTARQTDDILRLKQSGLMEARPTVHVTSHSVVAGTPLRMTIELEPLSLPHSAAPKPHKRLFGRSAGRCRRTQAWAPPMSSPRRCVPLSQKHASECRRHAGCSQIGDSDVECDTPCRGLPILILQ
jgi:hypothetical protein